VRSDRPRRRSVGLALAALAVACSSPPKGSMVRIPPPHDWQARLVAFRADKDRSYATSQDSPVLAEDRVGFAGLAYWAPDSRYYFVGPLHRYAQPERFEIVSTAGVKRPCVKLGWIGFTIDGTPLRLQVYRLLDGADGLFLPFTDATTGSETYPAGRYVDLVGPDGGPFVLDFNAAYNPSCAYGAPERFQCPVTPTENRLAVRIEAGERGYRHPVRAGAGT